MHTLREEDFPIKILKRSLESDEINFYNQMLFNYVPSIGSLVKCKKCQRSGRITLYKINGEYYCKDCKKGIN